MVDATVLSSPAMRGACSHAPDVHQAVSEIAAVFNGMDTSFVLFFCSADYDLERLATALSTTFGDNVIGCTSAGEVTPNGYQNHSITALAFDARYFVVSARLIEPIDRCDLAGCQQLISDLEEDCCFEVGDDAKSNSFAISLLDGLSAYEEIALLALNTALGRIPHFGGSAADETGDCTYVFHGGRFHTHAAVVALFKTSLPFAVFSMHNLYSDGGKMVVTEADAETRRVYELNAAPAIEEYARQIGIAVDEITMETFALHPMAIRLGDKYFIRSVQKVMSDGSLVFYGAVESGVVLSSMQSDTVLQKFSERLDQIKAEVGGLQATLGFDCFMRRLETETRHQTEQVSALLKQYRVIGFNTFGEQFEGVHLNQTFTGVVIGSGEVQ